MHFVREGSSPFRGTILFMVSSKRNTKIFKAIPIIDISSLISNEKDQVLIKKTASQIKDACRNVGFFYIKNHHIPSLHIKSVIQVVNSFFFDLSLEQKNENTH